MDVEHVADAEGHALLRAGCQQPGRWSTAARFAKVALAVASLVGCGAGAPREAAAPPPIAVAVVGSPSTRAPLVEAIAELRPSEEVRLRRVELPADVEPSVPDAAAARASEAHRALVQADAPRCLELLEGEELNEDLASIVTTYQDAGLIVGIADVKRRAISPAKHHKRGWLTKLADAFMGGVDFKRRADGGYGRRVPVPPEPSHG